MSLQSVVYNLTESYVIFYMSYSEHKVVNNLIINLYFFVCVSIVYSIIVFFYDFKLRKKCNISNMCSRV